MWKPGRADNNCDTNTDNVATFLSEKEVETSQQLYIATDWANVDKRRLTTALRSLEGNGFKVHKDSMARICRHIVLLMMF